MKKRFLSLLMALCLMLTLAPAAFATDSPNMIVGPDGQTYEIPDLTLAVSDDASADAGIATASVTYGGLGTASEPYTVDSAEALYALATEKFNKTTVTYSYINITDDIDFSELTSTISEWNGYFKYFYGEIRGVSSEGTAPVIKGLPTNRFLIYGWCGGTIENLTIDPDGNAGILTFIPCKLNGSYGSFTVKNVTVSSDVAINLSEGDNQANYCPLIYAGAGTFSMTDCVIDANVRITGTTYGSLFHGYYPMDPTGSYTFTNCVNNGTLTMRHAAMFFGNNSAFTGSNKAYYAFNEDDVSANRIRFSECVNNGKIYGTQTANLFATRASGNGATDEISDAYESYLNTSGSKPTDSVQVIGQDLGMTLTYDASGNLSMTAATDNTVDHYIVSVYSYVNAYYTVDDPDEYFPDGTDRVGAQQTLTGSETTIDLKYYGLCDYPYGTEGLTFEDDTVGGFFIANYNGHKYYWVNSAEGMPRENGTYFFFVGSPSQPAVKNTPDLVTLSAYSATGTLLGTVSATPEGE